MTDRTLVITLGVVLAILLAWSGIAPYERSTWLMEVAPIFIAVPVMAYSYRRFPLTRLLYAMIFVHSVILLVGGAYTYARVPFGFWMQEVLGIEVPIERWIAEQVGIEPDDVENRIREMAEAKVRAKSS